MLAHSWCLNFGNRVRIASVKNFQLCFGSKDPEPFRLQFGKVREEGLASASGVFKPAGKDRMAQGLCKVVGRFRLCQGLLDEAFVSEAP